MLAKRHKLYGCSSTPTQEGGHPCGCCGRAVPRGLGAQGAAWGLMWHALSNSQWYGSNHSKPFGMRVMVLLGENAAGMYLLVAWCGMGACARLYDVITTG